MSIVKKLHFLLNNPFILAKYFQLRNTLRKNKIKKQFNLVFQCDVPMHFNYLEPYYKALKNEPGINIFFSGHFNGSNVKKILIKAGVPSANIIEHVELIARTRWDLYMSPTSWGNIFPRNHNCVRIQIFHTLADKNIQYGENLLTFNTIFVCGPIHHDFLNKYLFTPFPEAQKKCQRFDIGYPKLDDLFNGQYSANVLREELNIAPEDPRKIILYAPNWEKYSALHRYGRQAFETLINTHHIVLVKLHYMSLLSPEDVYATGGIDWKELLNEFRNIENIRIIDNHNINPYLFLADMLVTDYGGVAFEYICTKKPIIYLDCPDFFESRGQDIMEYWSRDTGIIVSELKDLKQEIEKSLLGDVGRQKMREKLAQKILFNPGRGAEKGKEVILDQILKVSR